jgi:hypothetical protein
MWRCALVDCFNPQREADCLVLLNTQNGLAFTDVAGPTPRLPRLSIPGWSSTAKQIQAEIRPWRCIRTFGRDTAESSSEDTKITRPEFLIQIDSAESHEELEWAKPEVFFRSLSGEGSFCLNRFLHWNSRRLLSRVGRTHKTLPWSEQQVTFTPNGEICRRLLDCGCTNWCFEDVQNRVAAAALSSLEELMEAQDSSRNSPDLEDEGLRSMPIDEEGRSVPLQCSRHSENADP